MPTTLTRWDPFHELTHMRGTLDRLFDQNVWRLPGLRNGDAAGSTALGIDVYETNDEYVVKAAVPGVDPKDLDIQVEDDVLTISGEFHQAEQANETSFLRRELRYGAFHRSLRLPPTVDAGHAEASFEHGLLKLTLPKKPEAKARTIKITPQGVVEGEKAQSS